MGGRRNFGSLMRSICTCGDFQRGNHYNHKPRHNFLYYILLLVFFKAHLFFYEHLRTQMFVCTDLDLIRL